MWEISVSEEEKRILEQQLWKIADTLRGKMNADEFRVYILGFIFYKYLSEKFHLKANKELEGEEDKIDYADLDDDSEYVQAVKDMIFEKMGFMLNPSELFSSLTIRGNLKIEEEGEGELGNDEAAANFILADLTSILNNIEQSTMGTESEDDFGQLFEDLDLTSSKLGRTESAKNSIIATILAHLSKIDFNLANREGDVLGDAYEYLIAKFASGAGKKAGEFYTPQPVSRLLAKIVTMEKQILQSVYDPTCGSGSLLLRIGTEAKVGEYFGQEMNRTTYNLARMNMILHDINYRNFDIKQEDTLERPQHGNKKFSAIVANPPFSAKWKPSDLLMSDDRFAQYGRLAPASKADFAFIQHMLYHLDDGGTMAVVMPHGVLFRGGAEGVIRKYIIADSNVLDAVIGLPANIFYGTSIPTCILVFKKCRASTEDILFIDASAEFEKGKNQNILRAKDIEKIISTLRKRETSDKYSYVANLEEIAENDYNLNIPRYVDTFEEEEEIDLEAVTAELAQIDSDMVNVDAKIAAFCTELGIKAPF